MNDALSPHTSTPLSPDADATVTGTDIIYLADLQPQPVEWLWEHRLAAGTLAMLSGSQDRRLRRISTRRSTRQDGQINYLATLTIFKKQTTYLATLPNRRCLHGKAIQDTKLQCIQVL